MNKYGRIFTVNSAPTGESEVNRLNRRLARLRCVQKLSSARRRAEVASLDHSLKLAAWQIDSLRGEVKTLRQVAARNADCHRRDYQRLVQAVGLLRRIVAGLDQVSQIGRGWVLVIPGLGNAIDEARAMIVGFEGKT